MLLVVDANAVMKDPLLRDRKWQVAQDAIDAGRLRLVLPEVARIEAVAGYLRSHREKIRQLTGILRKSSREAKDEGDRLRQIYESEMLCYEGKLQGILRQIGFELADPPDAAHLDLVARAAGRIAPFDENGGGYRDTLIWLTALEQIEDAPFDNLTLLSDDSVFTKRRGDLADEAQREVDAQLTVLRSLADVEFPGEYESGDFDLSDLDIDEPSLLRRIAKGLTGRDITRWSPPGPDYAAVTVVGHVELSTDGAVVKKRYGVDIYDLSVEATADVDVEVYVFHDAVDGDVDYSPMAARWDIRLRWHGEFDDDRHLMESHEPIEILEVRERVRRGLRNDESNQFAGLG